MLRLSGDPVSALVPTDLPQAIMDEIAALDAESAEVLHGTKRGDLRVKITRHINVSRNIERRHSIEAPHHGARQLLGRVGSLFEH